MQKPKKAAPKEQLLLVAFGTNPLSDVMKWIGTEKELDAIRAAVKWPPIYIPMRLCSQDDISLFHQYVDFLRSRIETRKDRSND